MMGWGGVECDGVMGVGWSVMGVGGWGDWGGVGW